MRARYYHPWLGRFISEDPIQFDGGMNWYGYCDGDPLMRSDPSGLWFGLDDAIFAGVGAVVGVGGKFVGNVITGNSGTWEDYIGAAVGGAVGGETLLYTANPFLAGAAGGASGNITTQGLKLATGKQDIFSASSLVVDTGIGTLTGFIPGRPIAGVSAGRNSSAAVFQQIVTKAGNGTIGNVTQNTAQKMVTGAFVKFAFVEGSVAGTIASNFYGNVISQMSPQPQSNSRK